MAGAAYFVRVSRETMAGATYFVRVSRETITGVAYFVRVSRETITGVAFLHVSRETAREKTLSRLFCAKTAANCSVFGEQSLDRYTNPLDCAILYKKTDSARAKMHAKSLFFS